MYFTQNTDNAGLELRALTQIEADEQIRSFFLPLLRKLVKLIGLVHGMTCAPNAKFYR